MAKSPTKSFLDRAFKSRRTRECYICGKRITRDQATVDHFVPKSKGGYNRAKNFKICCSPCNGRKADLMPYPHVLESLR